MESPALPSKHRTLRGALTPSREFPLLWREAIATFAAMFLAGWLAWLAGYRPPEAARFIHGHFSLGEKLNFEYGLFVIGKVMPAVIVAMFVVFASAVVPRKRSVVSALAAGVVMLAAMFLAWAAVKNPVTAGLTAGAVMGLWPLAQRRGGTIGGIVPLLACGYFFFAVMGVVKKVDTNEIFAQAGLGVAAAFVIIIAAWIVRRTTGFAPIRHMPARPQPPGPPTPFFAPGQQLRRAALLFVLLGTSAGLYSATKDHNAFWVFVTIWVVMQPTPDATFNRGIKRIAGVLGGCLVIAGIAQVATPEVTVTIGFVVLFAGLLWWLRNYAIYVGAITVFTVALHGSIEHMSFEHWAWLRFIDSLIGLAIAFLAYYLVVTLPDVIRARRAP